MSSQFVKLPAVSGGGSGANTNLSNLTAPISINQDLIPDAFNPMTLTGRQLGSMVRPWVSLYTVSVYAATVNTVPGFDLSISAGFNSLRFVENSLSTSNNGYVWTLQDKTTGRGAWAAAAGAGDYFKVPSVSGDPATPVNGAIWYNTVTNKLRAHINGVSVDL